MPLHSGATDKLNIKTHLAGEAGRVTDCRRSLTRSVAAAMTLLSDAEDLEPWLHVQLVMRNSVPIKAANSRRSAL